MAKSAAERKREQRERLKASGKFQSFKENESKKQKSRRIEKKKSMTIVDKEALQVKKREEMRKYRMKKSMRDASENQSSTSFDPNSDSPRKAFKSPMSFGKAIAKVKRNLPKSPNKCKALVKRLAQQLVPDILKSPPQLSRVTKLSNEVVSHVVSFLENDSISYQAPGTRDFIIMKDDEDNKNKIQKRYLTLTLGETYEIFKTENPSIKIGRSKFCELRPDYICLRHQTPSNLCLCIYHENIRLILQAIKQLPNYTSEFVKLIICDGDIEDCHYGRCSACGNFQKYHNVIEDLIDDTSLGEEIKYSQWIKDETKTVVRENVSSTLKEAIGKLENKLPQFLKHVYIKRQQETFFFELKAHLPTNTLLIHFDFSENYSFFYQDEIQSAHWVSKSCTLYTALAYFIYKDEKRTVPIVVVSNYMQHDKYAVAVFNEKIIEKIQCDYPDFKISRLIYQSDGTGQHFKQKYSICIAMFQPFDNVEWHFSATSHGKGPIDGLGGTMKRRIKEATLSRKIDPHSAEEFFHCAQEICPNVTLLYISDSCVKGEIGRLKDICSPKGKEIFPIPETQKSHCFLKVKKYLLKIANVSLNPQKYYTVDLTNGNVAEVDTSQQNSETEFDVGNWVLVPFVGKRSIKYFVGQILSKDAFSIKVKYLQWKGGYFTWPEKEDSSDIDIEEEIKKLPEPNFGRRTHITFPDYDFTMYSMA